MLLRNKSEQFQRVDGVVVRPYRQVMVGENCVYDKEVFERVGLDNSSVSSNKIKKKNIYDKGE